MTLVPRAPGKPSNAVRAALCSKALTLLTKTYFKCKNKRENVLWLQRSFLQGEYFKHAHDDVDSVQCLEYLLCILE